MSDQHEAAQQSSAQPNPAEANPEAQPEDLITDETKPAETIPVKIIHETLAETDPQPTKPIHKPTEKPSLNLPVASPRITGSPLSSPKPASPLASPKFDGSDKDAIIQSLQRRLKEEKQANEVLRSHSKESKEEGRARLEKEVSSLKSKLEQRNIAADSFRKQAVTLQLELDTVLDKIKKADEYIAKGTQLEDKILSLNKEIALLQGMNEQNSTLASRVAELSSTIDKKNEQIRLLKQDIDRRDQEILTVKTQVRELKVEQLARESQISELKKALDRSTQIKNTDLSTSAGSDNFVYDINVRDDEKVAPEEKPKEANQTQKEFFDDLSQKLSSALIDLENSQKALKHQTEIAVQFEKEITELKAKNLEAKVEAQRNQLDQIRAQFKTEEAHKAKLAQDLEKSKEESTELLKKLEKSNAVEQQNTSLNNQITQMSNEITRLEEALSNSEKLCVEARKDFEVQAFKASASIMRTQAIKSTLLEANAEARKVEEQTRQSQANEIENLKSRLREVEEMLKGTRESSAETKTSSRVNGRKARSFETLVDNLKQEITVKDSNIKDLQIKVEELKKEKHKVALEMEKYKSESSNLAHRLGMKTATPATIPAPDPSPNQS